MTYQAPAAEVGNWPVPGSARAACIPSLYTFVTYILPSASSATEWMRSSKSLHPIGPQFPLCAAEGWTTVSSRMLEKRGEPGGGFLRCARVLPAQSQPRLARGVGRSHAVTFEGYLRRPCHFGASSLRVSVCGYFERGEAVVAQSSSYHILSPWKADEVNSVKGGPEVQSCGGGNLAVLSLYVEETKIKKIKLV